MTEPGYRVDLSEGQLLAERVHLSRFSPVTLRAVRTQRVAFIVLGAIIAVLGLVLAVLRSWGPDGQVRPADADPVLGGVALVFGLMVVAIGAALPVYYRYAAGYLERRMWAYLGDEGAVLVLSPTGLVLEAPGRRASAAWAYYDDAVVLPGGLELRRRGGPVAFYAAEAFGSQANLVDAGARVRSWILTARGATGADVHAE